MNLQNIVDYCRRMDLPEPFTGVILPAPLDPEMCKSVIMLRCGLLTPIINDPVAFTAATSIWFTAHQYTFAHMINIIQAEYSPIENTDRYETGSNTSEGSNTGEGSSTRTYRETGEDSHEDNATHSGTSGKTGTHSETSAKSGSYTKGGTTSETITREVSAMNASGYQADNKETKSGSSSETGENAENGTESGQSAENGTESATDRLTHEGEYEKNITDGTVTRTGGSDTRESEHSVHIHGNIGVTTNQQLMTSEIDWLKFFNSIYDQIAEMFEHDNMIGVY